MGHLQLPPGKTIAVHLGTDVDAQCLGQAHHMLRYERLVEYIAGHDGVWFATIEEIARAWVDDETDEARFALPDVRGVEPAPADSGWA
jgi:hypothetical protein